MKHSNRVSTVIGSGALAARPERTSPRGLRLVAGLLIVGALGANVAAASLGISGQRELGIGLQDVTACDTDGFAVVPVSDYATASSAFTVTAVQLGGTTATTSSAMAAGCAGKTLTMVLLTSNTATSGTLTVTSAIPNSATGNVAWPVDLGATVLSADIVKVVIQIQD